MSMHEMHDFFASVELIKKFHFQPTSPIRISTQNQIKTKYSFIDFFKGK